jgi:hypothetical protein
MRMPASSGEWMDHALVDRRVDVEVYRMSAGRRHDRPVRPEIRNEFGRDAAKPLTALEHSMNNADFHAIGSVGRGGSVGQAENSSRFSAYSHRNGLLAVLKIRVSMVRLRSGAGLGILGVNWRPPFSAFRTFHVPTSLMTKMMS